ncbi:hypothetical protein RHSIM_Rhsim08G0241800 [Rhododendron simsii]|uniref:COP1-interacting protein 7 n=1 Tax=Rhododendron simsii TaxID=118357 RepID=A0A834GNR0_RHOSS|nr:hypothetical protein RHSIM_Rhsim08G0241800 [Rhododendron simsii]
MKSGTPLDYAIFQLSPKRSRCELFVSSNGNIEKLASGLVKPFVTHLKVAEEQVALAVQSIRLDVKHSKNVETWFTKGTLERFVRFVSTPEVLELVDTFDTEMSQLEAARRIYSQVGAGNQLSSSLSGDGAAAAADATKYSLSLSLSLSLSPCVKELLRAIDVRLGALRQDLTTACARAAAAGFNLATVSELKLFADQFGAIRLNDACSKFIALCERRPDLINPWKATVDDAVRSSWESDMSIDEDPSEELPSGPKQPQCHHPESKHLIAGLSDATQQHLEQSKPARGQQLPNPSSVSFPIRGSRESSVDRDEDKETHKGGEEEEKGDGVNQNESSQTPKLTRRLSVQDRISLFENKQKENSGSGGKPPGKSAELRRSPSDVSSVPNAVEKAVLKRWSGASDMSIDLGGEKRDIESPLCTPSSSSVSQTKPEEQKAWNDTSASEKPELKSSIGRVSGSDSKHQTDPQIRVGVASGQEAAIERKVGLDFGTPSAVSNGLSTGASESSKFTSTLATVESDGGKDHTRGRTQSQIKSNFYRAEDDSLTDQVKSQIQSRSLSGGRQEQIGFTDKGRSKGYFAGDESGGIKMQAASEAQIDGEKDRAVSLSHLRVESKGQRVSHSMEPPRTAVDSGQSAVSGVKFREASATRYKGIEGDSLASQSQGRSFGVVEEVGNKDLGPSEKQPVNTTKRAEDTGHQRMNFQEQFSTPEWTKKSQARREEKNSDYRNKRPELSGKIVSEDQEDSGTVPTVPGEQFQRVRQPKGNQELNDELKMKANELEKLFAEHKSSSARKNKPEQAASLTSLKPPAEIAPAQTTDKNTMTVNLRDSKMSNFSTPPMKMLDNQDDGDSLKQKFSDLGLSEDSRGKFYERYMQKRDAKLREEWSSRRAEKEAKMKAMQDRFESSRTEIKASFSGSVDRQDSAAGSTRRRAERLRSFNSRSNVKREQHPIDLLQSEDEEDLSEFAEQVSFGHERSLSETSIGDIASKSSQTKKLLLNKNLPYSTPRTSAVPVQRSAVRASNSSTGRRKMQSENPLAQSVPNFSDLRKENTKPSSGVSKTTTRPQARNYARSKSNGEEISLMKEEKTRRSQFLRKSSATPAESSLDSEGIVLTPLKFDKEQTVNNPHDKLAKNVESKPFLRKGNGIGPGAGAVIAKMKFSMASETMDGEEESDQLVIEPEELVDAVEDNEEEESEVTITEDNTDMDNGKPILSQEFDKFNYGSESGDALRSFSQVDPSFVAELPAAVGSTFHPADSVQDSPAESPVSWNSRMQNAFSYAHETSDVDASADSPIGSPVSWNSHSLNQAEADAAARMRKKWGSAQKPVLVANSSHSQPRKDVTKGFKRLLKFGRKSRGTDSLVDWISATTSEGDDDTEDGRDPANRSSEDLRKSRMGYSQGHPSDDSFNESEFYSEQVQALYSSIPAPPSNFKLRDDHLSGGSVKVRLIRQPHDRSSLCRHFGARETTQSLGNTVFEKAAQTLIAAMNSLLLR